MGIGVSSTELSSDSPLCAEDRETDTKCKCLPVAAELLATCGTEREATHELDQRGRKDERDDSRPLWHLCAHWNKPLLLGLRGDRAGLVNHDLCGVIVGRVASRAELLMDTGAADTLLL